MASSVMRDVTEHRCDGFVINHEHYLAQGLGAFCYGNPERPVQVIAKDVRCEPLADVVMKVFSREEIERLADPSETLSGLIVPVRRRFP